MRAMNLRAAPSNNPQSMRYQIAAGRMDAVVALAHGSNQIKRRWEQPRRCLEISVVALLSAEGSRLRRVRLGVRRRFCRELGARSRDRTSFDLLPCWRRLSPLPAVIFIVSN
jgi:hypothetical protein